MTSDKPRFVLLKAINGEPMLVNLSLVRTVATINLAGDDVGVISFDKEHEVVVGSTVQEVLAAMAAAPAPMAD
jgi:hypothetical protein